MILNPVLGPRAPFLLFFIAIHVATTYGGYGSGLLSVFLSAAVSCYWLAPVGFGLPIATTDLFVMAIFVGVGIVIVSLADRQTRTRQQSVSVLPMGERSDQQVAGILETLSDAFCTFDRKWRFTYINDVALHLIHRRKEDLLGKEIWSSLPEICETEFETRMRAAMQSGNDDHFEAYSALLGGWFEYRIYPSTEGLSLYTVDISQRKQHAEERERLLESERAARADSERASRLKDEFLATLSHELRTPLNAILGWATLIRVGTPQKSDILRAMETIERNAKLQAQLIDDLLDMNRIISGKLRLEVQRVDLPLLVESALESVRPAADARGIQITKNFSQDDRPVRGDPARLQQIIWNLLSNAIKFTPPGGTVNISLPQSEGQSVIEVADTGEGMAAEFLPYIFDRFRQSDSSTTRRHGGLGLGLAIVRHLAELHGGTVEARSEGQGKGSTFTVRLPLNVLAADGSPRRTWTNLPVVIAEPVAPIQLNELKILVVDDEPDARDLLKRILEERHAQVETSPSAAHAFETLHRWQPDVLVSDIGMPGEDGYQLIHRIRRTAIDGLKSIPAVAVTAFVRNEDRERALQAGYHAHLAKPVTATDLIAVVAKISNKNHDAQRIGVESSGAN
jgi:signal transduction histidine kinase/CheY-like chemotaxis protein